MQTLNTAGKLQNGDSLLNITQLMFLSGNARSSIQLADLILLQAGFSSYWINSTYLDRILWRMEDEEMIRGAVYSGVIWHFMSGYRFDPFISWSSNAVSQGAAIGFDYSFSKLSFARFQLESAYLSFEGGQTTGIGTSFGYGKRF